MEVTTPFSSPTRRDIFDGETDKDWVGSSSLLGFTLFSQMLFNLANQYANNEMYYEALNTYQVITKNKMFTNAHRLKVNMGNIYVQLGQFQKAIKMYRMALDQVPNTHKSLRYIL